MPNELGDLYNFELQILRDIALRGTRASRKAIWIKGWLTEAKYMDFGSNMYKQYSRFCKSHQMVEITGGTIKPGTPEAYRTTLFLLKRLQMIEQVPREELTQEDIEPQRGHLQKRNYYRLTSSQRVPFIIETMDRAWLNPLDTIYG